MYVCGVGLVRGAQRSIGKQSLRISVITNNRCNHKQIFVIVSEKLKIGISIGDVNGIGLEVIIKTLVDNHIYDYFTPIVYGHTKVASFHRRTIDAGELNFHVINHPSQAQPRKANMINCWEEDVKIDLGEINETGGKYAFLSLQRATNDLVNGDIDALVTAPINKDNIQNEEFKFPGHTEYLQERAGVWLPRATAFPRAPLRTRRANSSRCARPGRRQNRASSSSRQVFSDWP